ncbi:MAG: hypothetical protein IPI49_05955 [Myxococcales bacterium]|jgi:hypothetical protein|nr:hypothetical protein [Myxococcales bacterium]
MQIPACSGALIGAENPGSGQALILEDLSLMAVASAADLLRQRPWPGRLRPITTAASLSIASRLLMEKPR